MSGEHDSSPNNPQALCDDDWLKAAEVWWASALSEAGKGFRARLDAQAKREPGWVAEQVSPELFNQHVEADLLAVVQGFACFIRLDMADYSEAMDSCLAYAWRRGAWGLSAAHFAELQDWLHDQLALAIGPEI